MAVVPMAYGVGLEYVMTPLAITGSEEQVRAVGVKREGSQSMILVTGELLIQVLEFDSNFVYGDSIEKYSSHM